MVSTMEYRRLCLLLLWASLCSVCLAQLDVEVKILGSTKRMEKTGAQISLICNLNQGLPVILTHTIEWLHVSPSKPDGQRTTTLTSQKTLSDQASPDDYIIEAMYDDNSCNFTLVVKHVEPENDGSFVCRVTRNNDGARGQREVQVIVVNDVESVAMQFDGEESITDTALQTEIQREEGRYGVTCTAYGFNPDASLRLTLAGEPQETGGTQILLDQQASEAAVSRRYTATATAPTVDLRAIHSGQQLTCEAQAGFDGAIQRVASVLLQVIALEPVVTCDKNVSARVGDTYVKIECHVDHSNVDIDRYTWEIGDTGEILVPGQIGDSYNEVIVQEISPDFTIVILDLHEVDEWHFDTYYYLGIHTTSGQFFRANATLIELEPISSGPRMGAVLVVCVVSVVVSLFTSP